MRQQALNSLQEIGIEFRFGHDTFPLPNIPQFLWFRLKSNLANRSRASSQTYFWIEHASGNLLAMIFNNLEYQPDEVTPFLAGLIPTNCDERTLMDRFQESWLLSPKFCAAHVKAAAIFPQQDFLWEAIKTHAATILGMPDVSALITKGLEQVLEIGPGELGDRFAATLPELPKEALDFLSIAERFQARLDADMVAFFDEYAALLNARTHTIENYNTARSWTVTQRRNRIQAIRAFPWLFHKLGLQTGGPDHYHVPADDITNKEAAISDAIDLGQPLIPLLAKHYKLHKHTLRHACEFRTKLDSHSDGTWTLIPRQTGHRFRPNLDSPKS